MAEKVLIKGNEAIGRAAIAAGCRHYFGYPITPQTEIAEFLAKELPKVNGTFIQAESEVAAVNMVYGAAAAGARAMTSSSGPGISLKQEGLSTMAGAQIPCVIVDIMRGGPGLGSIQPSQPDYFQVVKGGGHGDYHNIVLAPNSVQEMYDLTMDAFDISDQYRNPVFVLADGALGQMMEPVSFDKQPAAQSVKTWALTGKPSGRERHIIKSLNLAPEIQESHNLELQSKYNQVREQLRRYEAYSLDDAELILVAYGISARIAQSAVDKARQQGLKVGLFRPITLWPFPNTELLSFAKQAKALLTVELSAGQLIEDVKLAVECSKPVHLYGRLGGMLPTPQEVLTKICAIYQGGE